MKIIHQLDSFLYLLFPKANNNVEKLLELITSYYKVGQVKPMVNIGNEYIIIDIDIEKVKSEGIKYNQLIALCDQGDFFKAKPIAEELVAINPSNSEYYRILGQINSEEKNYDTAVDYLIDSLRWDPKNKWALLLMGNVFLLKNESSTAMRYYNKVLELYPDDVLALNNIGVAFVKSGDTDDAYKFFEKAVIADPDYPNTYHGLALLKQMQKDYKKAYLFALDSLKRNEKRDQAWQQCLNIAFESAKQLAKSSDALEMKNSYKNSLEEKIGVSIDIIEDATLQVAAKIEYAEIYKRDKHIVKFNPKYVAVEHLIIHELAHLELTTEARKANVNMLFTTSTAHEQNFKRTYGKYFGELSKMGISDDDLYNHFQMLFKGLNSQIFNTPIDLFIEDLIYNRFEDLQPIQFISLYKLISEGVYATTNKSTVEGLPKGVVHVSKVLNMVNALLFKDLYGVDLLHDFKAIKSEHNIAEQFFEEFIEYRYNREPAEEFELIQHWADDLGFGKFFELVSETAYNNGQANRGKEDSIVTDGLFYDEQERATEKFIEEHANQEINKEVVMGMVEAIQYFKGMSQADIKVIAFEIATVGMNGINPESTEGYKIPSIKGSDFSGYKTLAYFYVSWAIAIPEMLSQTGLPFNKEYELAQEFLS